MKFCYVILLLQGSHRSYPSRMRVCYYVQYFSLSKIQPFNLIPRIILMKTESASQFISRDSLKVLLQIPHKYFPFSVFNQQWSTLLKVISLN